MADLKGRQNNASELRNREALIITGINRYIVGCKSFSNAYEWLTSAGINRYIVGCKYTKARVTIRYTPRINRYIVGCKFLRHADINKLKERELIDT